MKPMSMNRVYLAGNLTRDPALRKTPGGLSVTDLSVAANEERTTREGKKVKQTCFADVAVWGKQAEACGAQLKKGSPVLVEGKLQFQQWESKEGQKRSRLLIQADRVHFMSPTGATPAASVAEEDPLADLEPVL